MANNIELREINKLIKEKFFIPTYQRGYRWDTQQVNDILNDIYEFMDKGDIKNEEFYCLQPIVVKKRSDNYYDVIDGQQRLTTIMIIQKYLGKRTYNIEYESRPGSRDFLNNINQYAEEEYGDKNIDYYFMINAYQSIEKWFEEKVEEEEEYSLPDEFSTYIMKYCKVIWYEVDDGADAENIFTRLNIGKIPLTNAELIKALFLKKTNFESTTSPTYLRQLEIATEWDQIENTLQNDKIWYFINPQYEMSLETRIEYIFDIIAGNNYREGDYYTFYRFSELLELNNIFTIWDEIKEYFRTIIEWYNNQILFHLIGFITSSTIDVSVEELLSEYFNKEYKKDEFLGYIKSIIAKHFEGINIEELSYDYSSDQPIIRDILLLFNVITVMKKSSAYSRFPFDSYNKNHWSLEHIHAQNCEGIGNSKELWLAWIDEHLSSFKQFTDEKYKAVVEVLEEVDRDNITFEEFDNLFNNICLMIQDDYGIDLHDITNLALLDVSSNSSISNNFFDVKRKMIVNMDKNGDFIPVCTRNVFLKYYSEDVSQIHYWSGSDRKNYLDSINKMLGEFINNSEQGEEEDD